MTRNAIIKRRGTVSSKVQQILACASDVVIINSSRKERRIILPKRTMEEKNEKVIEIKQYALQRDDYTISEEKCKIITIAKKNYKSLIRLTVTC